MEITTVLHYLHCRIYRAIDRATTTVELAAWPQSCPVGHCLGRLRIPRRRPTRHPRKEEAAGSHESAAAIAIKTELGMRAEFCGFVNVVCHTVGGKSAVTDPDYPSKKLPTTANSLTPFSDPRRTSWGRGRSSQTVNAGHTCVIWGTLTWPRLRSAASLSGLAADSGLSRRQRT